MQRKPFVGLVLLWPLTVCAADKIEPLNVKPGLWETTYTAGVSGVIPLSEQQLAALPPESRARLEKMWKEKAQGGQTRTVKSCLTEEHLKRDPFADNPSKSCTVTVLASSSTKQDVREECRDQDGTKITTYRLQASSPEKVTGTMKLEMNNGGRASTIDGTFNGRWLGGVCGDVE